MTDLEDGGKFDGTYIPEYLEQRGICLGRQLNSEESARMESEVTEKFKAAGFQVLYSPACDD
jgi:hypothetical protein